MDLAGDNLTGVNFTGTDLAGSNLRGSNLAFADLAGSDLMGSELRGARLTGSDLIGAELSGAQLQGATLQYADLSGAMLTGLGPTYKLHTNFNGATLYGANLASAVCGTPNYISANGANTLANNVPASCTPPL
jgi:uncharacterized protein YjbI with pentapeptide repeats